MSLTRIPLDRASFGDRQRYVVSHGVLGATAFRSEMGVDILQVYSDRVDLEILAFQGQQIWNARIDGRDITMESVVDTPVPTSDYLRNYGAFLVHCGATAMGGPSAEDSHPLHGELPNAPYNAAWLECGVDAEGNEFLEVHGTYLHQVAFTCSYEAHPVIRITSGSTTVDVSMTVTNMADRDMDLMYLAHINFLPIDGSEIVASHQWNNEHMRVRSSIPSHIQVTDEFRMFLKETAEKPELTRVLDADTQYDPEVVMTVDYISDDNGYAHTMQVHPDGASDYVKHQPANTPKAIRCIQRTPLHQCIGMVLPATAEVEGYIAEKEKGNVISIAPQEQFSTSFTFGALDQEQTKAMKKVIDSLVRS
jgi:hypothetical protein